MEKKQSAGRHEFNLFKKERSPYYYVRIMHMGTRRKFSTGETTIRKAQNKATAIVADIRSRGFDEAVKVHSRRRDKVPNDPSIDEFVALARKVFLNIVDPPSRSTYERYLRDITRVAKTAGAKKLSYLDDKHIERFTSTYTKNAQRKGRADNSIATSVQTIIRNCSALFAPRMISAYAKKGLSGVTNPFGGITLPRVKIIPYSPLPAGVLEKVCADAQLLKSGDQSAPPPVRVRNRAPGPDFRKPQLGAYVLFLLELGLGLRRNEADKAQWDWILPAIDGRHIIEIRETPYFIPKSRQSRMVPIPKQILDAISEFRRDDDPFIVPGLEPKLYPPDKQPLNIAYRCDDSHRALVTWLREHGVQDKKPCHRLRKEFGSAVATTFGLYAAQKMLGHSSPMVTDAHYAGLTQLPHLEDAGFYDNICGGSDNATDKVSGA